jgi:hypothetical protein
MPLTEDQLARRKAGQCEERGCPRPASFIVSQRKDPLNSWRLCAPHSQRDEKFWHTARIRETP